ncbi:MAG: hypothetical protein ACLTJG_06865 [[Clostridium] innocuum]
MFGAIFDQDDSLSNNGSLRSENMDDDTATREDRKLMLLRVFLYLITITRTDRDL